MKGILKLAYEPLVNDKPKFAALLVNQGLGGAGEVSQLH